MDNDLDKLLLQELTAAVVDTEAKKMGSVNFSIGWVKSFRDIVETLLASRQRDRAVQEAVIILPDDAKPEVGDFCEYGNGDERCPDCGNYFDFYYYYNHSKIDKIIQRNGKPVIYESAITAAAARLGE